MHNYVSYDLEECVDAKNKQLLSRFRHLFERSVSYQKFLLIVGFWPFWAHCWRRVKGAHCEACSYKIQRFIIELVAINFNSDFCLYRVGAHCCYNKGHICRNEQAKVLENIAVCYLASALFYIIRSKPK